MTYLITIARVVRIILDRLDDACTTIARRNCIDGIRFVISQVNVTRDYSREEALAPHHSTASVHLHPDEIFMRSLQTVVHAVAVSWESIVGYLIRAFDVWIGIG